MNISSISKQIFNQNLKAKNQNSSFLNDSRQLKKDSVSFTGIKPVSAVVGVGIIGSIALIGSWFASMNSAKADVVKTTAKAMQEISEMDIPSSQISIVDINKDGSSEIVVDNGDEIIYNLKNNKKTMKTSDGVLIFEKAIR